MTDPKDWDCDIYVSGPEIDEEEARAIETLSGVYCDGIEIDYDAEVDDPLDLELAIFITNAVRFARSAFVDRGEPELFAYMVTGAEFFMDAAHLTCRSTRMSMPAYLIASLAASFAMLWSPPAALSGAPLIAWTAVALFAFYTGFTLYHIPHQSLGAELTNDHHDPLRSFKTPTIWVENKTMIPTKKITTEISVAEVASKREAPFFSSHLQIGKRMMAIIIENATGINTPRAIFKMKKINTIAPSV